MPKFIPWRLKKNESFKTSTATRKREKSVLWLVILLVPGLTFYISRASREKLHTVRAYFYHCEYYNALLLFHFIELGKNAGGGHALID